MDAFGGKVTKSPMLDLPGQLGSLLLKASSMFGKGRLMYQVSYMVIVRAIDGVEAYVLSYLGGSGTMRPCSILACVSERSIGGLNV